jgi:hypothetical protein
MYFFHVSCIHTYVIVKTDCTFVVSFITMYNMWCLMCHKALLHFFFCIFWSFIGWKKSRLILHWVEEILFGPSLEARNLCLILHWVEEILFAPSLGGRNLVWSFVGCKKSCLILHWVEEILFVNIVMTSYKRVKFIHQHVPSHYPYNYDVFM